MWNVCSNKKGNTKAQEIAIPLINQSEIAANYHNLRDQSEERLLPPQYTRKQLEEGIAMNNSSDVDDIVFQKHGLVQEEDPSYTKANFENCSEAEKQGLLELFDKYPGIFGYSRYHCGTFSKWMVSFPTKWTERLMGTVWKGG